MTFLATSVPEGDYEAIAYASLGGDMCPYDDTVHKSFLSRRHDVGVSEVLEPPEEIAVAVPATLKIKVKNYGGFPESFKAFCRIYSSAGSEVYRDSLDLTLPVGDSVETEMLRPWTPSAIGRYQVKAYTQLSVEQARGNDTAYKQVTVVEPGVHDCGVTQVLEPKGSKDTTAPILVQCKVKNFGDGSETFYTYAEINLLGSDVPVYSESVMVTSLPAGEIRQVNFPNWVGHREVGDYNCLFTTKVRYDVTTYNDTLSSTFRVIPVVVEGWQARPGMPPGPKGKGVKDGGALAYIEGTDAEYIYGLKGNNRTEFYRYDIATNTWVTKESLPWVGSSGRKKGVKKGGALTSVGGMVYAIKGNNSGEFWQYDPNAVGAYPWQEKAPVPGAGIKEGAGLAGFFDIDGEYVYCLKGTGGSEFFCYDVAANAWAAKANAPLGTSGKGYANGSCVVYANGYIYALKAKYNEFARYSIAGDSWVDRAPMPLVGRTGKKKKVGDGAALAYFGGQIYGFKGGNTRELWRYSPAQDMWFQEDDIPAGGGKGVKAGGALVAASSAVFGLKGNGTSEFYAYGPRGAALASLASGANENAMGKVTLVREYRFEVSPNPFSRVTRVSYVLPCASDVSVRVYDVAGSLVTTLAEGRSEAGEHTLSLDASELARGIYVLKFEATGYSSTQKLILE